MACVAYRVHQFGVMYYPFLLLDKAPRSQTRSSLLPLLKKYFRAAEPSMAVNNPDMMLPSNAIPHSILTRTAL